MLILVGHSFDSNHRNDVDDDVDDDDDNDTFIQLRVGSGSKHSSKGW